VSSASRTGHLDWKIDRTHGRGGTDAFGSHLLRDHFDLCNPYRAACLHGFRTGYVRKFLDPVVPGQDGVPSSGDTHGQRFDAAHKARI
jgi:hypothetical protein